MTPYPRPMRLLGIALLILAVTTVVTSAWTSYQQRQTARCQAQVNQRFLTTLEQRSALAEADRRNVARLVRAVAHSERQPEAEETTQAALRTFLRRQHRLDARQQRAAYPPLNEAIQRCTR